MARNPKNGSAETHDPDAPTGAKPIANSPALKLKIEGVVTQILKLQDQRSTITAKITELRQSLVAEGLNRHAINASIAYAKMEDDHREGFDMSLVVVREALGLPVQIDLWAGGGNDVGGTVPVHEGA